jgi:hypothetical protein
MLDPSSESSNAIRRMLDDRSDQTRPGDYRIGQHPKPVLWMVGTVAGAAMVVFGAPLSLWLGLNGMAALVVVVLCGLFGWLCFKNMDHANQAAKEYDLARVTHLQRLEQERLAQRPVALTTLKDLEVTRMNNLAAYEIANTQSRAQIEAAKYQALGQSGQLEFQKEMVQLQDRLITGEAARVRDWQTSENQKDRELKIDELITRFEGKIDELKIRMEYEKPDAKSRMAESMVELEGQVARLKKIAEYEDDDPVMFNALFQKFKREG